MTRQLLPATLAALYVGFFALDLPAQQLVSYHADTKTLSTPPKDPAYKYVITTSDFPPEGAAAEKLQIFGGILDSAVIRLICQYPNLKEIVLPDTNTSDGDLALTLSHTECEFLNVAGTNITNSSLSLIAGEKSIKKLCISSTGINRDGRRKLRELRPDLKLD